MSAQAEHLLKYFSYTHLSEKLQAVSAPFGDLARMVARELDGPEATVAVRKLLEAKDAAVRAALDTDTTDSIG